MILRISFLMILIPMLWTDAFSQVDEDQLRYALRGDSVYVYHIESVPLGEGFNIYRKDEGESDFQQLNDAPVQGVFYPEELPVALGDHYEHVQNSLESEDEIETFFSLRSNAILGRVYTFAYPEVAEVLGRLYIDATASPGENVTYRVEFVDDLGRPTGKVLEQEFTLEEMEPRPADNLEVSHKGNSMTLEWSYPSSGNIDDKVARFELYQSMPGSDEIELINEKLILRDDEKTDYEHHFTTNRVGSEMEFMVMAVDITGRRGAPGEIVNYYIEDNIAPGVIEDVTAEYVNGVIEVTWPVSPETDLSGYHIYRSMDLSEEFNLLQGELIDPLEPVFRDSTVSEGIRYFYKITAVDQAGNESPQSAAAMRHIADKTPPAVPAELTAEFNIERDGVELNWDSGERPGDLRRYILLRREISPDVVTNFNQIVHDDYIESSYLDAGVGGHGFQEGVFYEYGIVAADSSRNFSDTTTVRVQIPDLTPPKPPANVMADNRDGIRVDLSWNHTSSGDAVTYVIYREKTDSVLVEMDRVAVRDRWLRDETVVLGETYRYAISAVDSAGNEGETRFSEPVLIRNFDPPRSVRNVRVNSVSTGTEIRWEPVVASDLAGYKVYRSNLSTGVYEPLTVEPISDTTWTDENPGGEVWYRVRAVDTSGNESRPSEPVKSGG